MRNKLHDEDTWQIMMIAMKESQQGRKALLALQFELHHTRSNSVVEVHELILRAEVRKLILRARQSCGVKKPILVQGKKLSLLRLKKHY